MTKYEVDKSHWAFKLAPQLAGKAQQTYYHCQLLSQEIEALKAAILRRYNICEEMYRQRFPWTTKEVEAYQKLAIRLQDIQQKWMKGYDTLVRAGGGTGGVAAAKYSTYKITNLCHREEPQDSIGSCATGW